MSVLRYNGISLPFILTDTHEMKPEWTPDHADYLGTTITIGVTSTLSAATSGVLLAGETLGDAQGRIRHMLEQPRKELYYSNDGEVYHITQTGAHRDVRNGPHPEVLSVVRTVGDETLIVQFRVQFTVHQCHGKSEASLAPFLSHRYENTVEIDEDHRTTRVRTGTIEIPGGWNLDPDAFRFVAACPIPLGFRRLNSRYTVRSDGLALLYEFRDQEDFCLPPNGATRFEPIVRFTSAMPGAIFFCDVTVKLAGNKKASLYQLAVNGLRYAWTVLQKSGVTRSKSGRHSLRTAVTINVAKHEVEVSLGGMLRSPKKARQWKLGSNSSGSLGGFGALDIAHWVIQKVNAKPGDKENPTPDKATPTTERSFAPKHFGFDVIDQLNPGYYRSPEPGFRGTAGLKLVAAALNDPCLTIALNTAELKSTPNTILDPLNTAELKGGPLLPGTQPSALTTDPILAGLIKAGQEQLPQAPGQNTGPQYAQAPGGDLERSFRQEVSARSGVVKPAQINIANVLPEPFEETISGGLYTVYRIAMYYTEDVEAAVMPEQAVNGLTRCIKLAASTVKLKVDWSAERIGEPPVTMPKDLGNSNYFFLKRVFNPGTIDELEEDGVTIVYRKNGVYEYAIQDPRQVEYGAAVVPWVAELMGKDAKPIIVGGPDLTNEDNGSAWEANLKAFVHGLGT